VEPLAEHLRGRHSFHVTRLLGDQATKPALVSALASRRPALVYVAGHGIAAVDAPVEEQRASNGAICCARQSRHFFDDVFSAQDVDLREPLLEGAVVFQFGCHGYGTPATSAYSHWLERKSQLVPGPEFVAALPRRLLEHPRGPIAYLGHVDLAFLHAFTAGAPLEPGAQWHARMAPFVRAVDHLVTLDPAGRAMEDMNARYGGFNAMIAAMYDDIQRQHHALSRMQSDLLVENWIMRGDAKNYMLLGDPAVGLRLPAVG